MKIVDLGGGNRIVFSGEKIVELGGGDLPRFHPNIDCRKIPAVDIVADFEKPLPLPTDEYDGVYAQFVLEHISWRNLKQFISELYRMLRAGGQAILVTANLKAQIESLSQKEKWDLQDMSLVFGGQDFPENSHKSSLSPELAVKLFLEAGFNNVKILPYGLDDCATDMTIIVQKMDKADSFDRKYFEGGAYEGLYRDFGVHYKTAELVLDRKPESLLEVGGARGYICRILQSLGVPATCMDISPHCWHTRAVENFMLHDATITPWEFKDKQFDLCFSIAFLEHIPEAELEQVIKEMVRVSKRGLHGITLTTSSNDRDTTHVSVHPLGYWQDLFRKVASYYPVELLDKEDMEKGAINIGKMAPCDNLVKLNIGSFTDMFYYGWDNIDIEDLARWAQANAYVFDRMDVRNGFPNLQDNTVDTILASHFIEHLTREEGKKFLNECRRILKPEGILRLAVPDTKAITQSYLEGRIRGFQHVNLNAETAGDDAEVLYYLLIGGHQTIYDFDSLKKILEECGFKSPTNLKPFESCSEAIRKQTVAMYPTLSVYVEANPEKVAKEKISSPLKDYLDGKIAEGKMTCQ